MIRGSSGTGASSPVFPVESEIENRVTWISAFKGYYKAAKASKKHAQSDASTSVKDGVSQEATTKETTSASTKALSDYLMPHKINVGPNVRSSFRQAPSSKGEASAIKSRLLWCILLLLAVPLVIVNVIICTFVTRQATSAVPSWIEKVSEQSVQLEQMSLQGSALQKAGLVRGRLASPIRDLHLYSRVAGWLLFGGIEKSDAFTEVVEGTEDCKDYPTDDSCPFYDSDVAVCDCKWQDIYAASSCTDYGNVSTRTLPKRFFLVQARDADPTTGNRPKTLSFPEFDGTANSTLWYDDVWALPGADSGSNSSGFETTYDRIRSLSPMGVVGFPIYFYATAAGLPKSDLGTFVAFEADGSLSGFFGCDLVYATFAHFVSDNDTKAYEVDANLCPEGKYGYDPRCRSWYDEGRKAYLNKSTPFYISPLYPFSVTNEVAASATMDIANPTTGKYVGQTLLDISLKDFEALLKINGEPSAFMATQVDDVSGSNTAVRPEGSEGIDSDKISDLLLPNDPAGSPNLAFFDEIILTRLQSGNPGLSHFQRSAESEEQERLTLAFAPVYARVHTALDPSDYTRGVAVSETYLYTVGVFVLDEAMMRPFRQINDSFNGTFDDMKRLYILIIAAISVIFGGYMFWVAYQVTFPMIVLLRVLQQINRSLVGDSLPPLRGGSAEIRSVYSAFTKLYKVVQISNTAFFAGNIAWAYHFMTGARDLFRRSGDQKSIGIICSNIGNLYFASKNHPEAISLKEETIMECFDEAISIALSSFENAEGDKKAEFAQQVADRRFNRAMFCLSWIDRRGDAPEEIREMAYADIKAAKRLDRDTTSYWLGQKKLLDCSDMHFCRLLQRIRGLTEFWHDQGLRQVWNVRDLISDADAFLLAAWKKNVCPVI